MTVQLDRLPTRIDPDFLGFRDLLTDPERHRLEAATEVFENAVRPVVAEHWQAGTFPSQLLPLLAPLDLVSLGLDSRTTLLNGLMHAELSKVDLSMSTFLGVHSMLFSAAIHQLGSDEQRVRLLPDLLALRTTGAFALTEADHGSDISRNMGTTATRTGDIWTLNGSKRWIGNGTHADYVLIWARDTADGQIKGFIVPRHTPGLTTTAIGNKIGLRIVQNADIALDDVLIGDENRLAGAHRARRCADRGREPAGRSRLVHPHQPAVDELAHLGRVADGRAAVRRLRVRSAVRARARAVRQADRIVPAHPREARAHPGQRDDVAGRHGSHGAAARERCGASRARIPGEGGQ
jgi:hypothetical protein